MICVAPIRHEAGAGGGGVGHVTREAEDGDPAASAGPCGSSATKAVQFRKSR